MSIGWAEIGCQHYVVLCLASFLVAKEMFIWRIIATKAGRLYGRLIP